MTQQRDLAKILNRLEDLLRIRGPQLIRDARAAVHAELNEATSALKASNTDNTGTGIGGHSDPTGELVRRVLDAGGTLQTRELEHFLDNLETLTRTIDQATAFTRSRIRQCPSCGDHLDRYERDVCAYCRDHQDKYGNRPSLSRLAKRNRDRARARDRNELAKMRRSMAKIAELNDLHTARMEALRYIDRETDRHQ